MNEISVKAYRRASNEIFAHVKSISGVHMEHNMRILAIYCIGFGCERNHKAV